MYNTYPQEQVNVDLCLRACLHTSIYLSIFVCTNSRANISKHTRALVFFSHTHARARKHIYIRTQPQACAQTHTSEQTNTLLTVLKL